MTAERDNNEFQYTGDVDAFHKGLAAITTSDEPDQEEAPEEGLPEGEQQEEPPVDEQEDDDADEEEEDKDDSELSKEELERLFNDKEAQKVLKNRYIRELKQERKEKEAEIIRQASELTLARKQVEAYQKAMDEFFAGQKPREQEEQDDFEPVDKEAHDRVMKEIKAIKDAQEGEKAKTDEEKKFAAAVNAYNNDVNVQWAAFKENAPDLDQAVQHITKIKLAEYKRLGEDPEKAAISTSKWLDFMGQQAWAKNLNVAEYAYEMAKEWGYQASAVKQEKKAPNLDAIRKNQKLTAPERPSSSVGIGNGADPLPKNQHGEVDPDRFHALLAKYS